MTGRRPRRPTVLVTGVGAPVGVSILKALRQSEHMPRLIGTDVHVRSVGLFRVEAGYVLPRVTADEAGYVSRLEEICAAEDVAMVCFGSEPEIRRLAPHRARLEESTGAKLIVNEPALVEAFLDKWTTVQLLRERGLPAPDSALVADREGLDAFFRRHDFPVILKPRRGSGSKGIHLVHDEAELTLLAGYVSEALVQELLLPDSEEYTVGVYKSARTGYVGQIVLRRELAAGLTYRAEVVHEEEIEATCRSFVEAFDLWGPINIQLRKTADGIRIFEVNARFSSSAVMRAHFGFNEPEMCLRDTVLGERLEEPHIRDGYAFRYWDEVYLEPDALDDGYPALRGLTPRGSKIDAF